MADADEVIDRYERHARAWVGARVREGAFAERGWLDEFCRVIGARGAVLDLGCGGGEPMASYLVTRGYSVTGVDSSRAMVEMFRGRLPDQEAVVADMRSVSLGRVFSGVLVWDSFFHLAHEDQRRMFEVFRGHVAPGGALMFTSGSSHGEAIGRLEGEPLYHASLDSGEYWELLDGHGFDVVAHVADDRSCGGRAIWLARRR